MGVTVTVRLPPLPPKTRLPAGTRVGLAETPLTVRLAGGVSTSATVKERVSPLVPAFTLWSANSEITGRSFTGLTVRAKLRLLLAWFVSVTVRVRVATPNRLVEG